MPETGTTWSLERRLSRWVIGGVAVSLVVGTALVAWFFEVSLDRELDALAVEEIAELEVGLMQGPVGVDDIARLVHELDLEHPEARIGLAVWRSPFDAPWLVTGLREPGRWPSAKARGGDETQRLSRTHRARGAWIDTDLELEDGTTVRERIRAEVLIDGRPRQIELRRLGLMLLVAAAAAGAAAVAGGVYFSRRLATLLAQVAESAGAARLDPGASLSAPSRAPEEIRLVADAFRASMAELREQHARNLIMTAGLAHELRSPLQNLISEAEVALLRITEDHEHRALLTRQLAELRGLALVVDNLITLTSLRDSELLPRQSNFDLASELAIRLSHEEAEASRRDISVEVQQHGDCTLAGDREALVLMARNLVGNAVRWTPPATVVTVTLDGRGDHLALTVDDAGPGVPVAEREAIFEAFYRGQSPEGMRAGYGLGLALARKAARSQGGDITVGTSDTGGARFVATLGRGVARARPLTQDSGPRTGVS